MRTLIVMLPLGLLACVHTLRSNYTTQASAHALDCALDVGMRRGYTPTAGGVNGGFIRLERPNRPKLFGSDDRDVVTVAVSRGQLNAEAATFDNQNGQEERASSRAKSIAAEIVDRCRGDASST